MLFSMYIRKLSAKLWHMQRNTKRKYCGTLNSRKQNLFAEQLVQSFGRFVGIVLRKIGNLMNLNLMNL